VVLFDLLLPMDKFTTADVMREVSLFDTIDTAGRYTVKVRTLCQYHRGRCVAHAMRKKRSFGAHLTPMRPHLTPCVSRCVVPISVVDEVDDPLYGSSGARGGAEEVAAVSAAAALIDNCCQARPSRAQKTRC
jgi:hypothetical protein